MHHFRGLAFPDDPEWRRRIVPVYQERRFDSKRVGILSRVTQLVLKFARQSCGQQTQPSCRRPGSTLRPIPDPVTLGACPPCPLDGSLGLCRSTRAARGSACTAATLGRVWLETPAGCSMGGAAVGSQAEGYRVQVTERRGLLEAIQDPLPETKWGLVSGSPGLGSEGTADFGVICWVADTFSPGLFVPAHGAGRGGVGRAGEVVRGEILGRKLPGFS